MTTLSDILDVGLLEKAIKEKFVKVVKHPTLPLRIYNYTPQAQYKNEWTTEVMASRGLIVGPNDEIIARDPSKFFNYGQPGAPEVGLDQYVTITRKEDGSLGIGWYYDGHYGVATRGSFTSDQAMHATALLSENDKQKIRFYHEQHNRTEIFEIVYPDNRIVVDYGDLDKLIRLGQVDNHSGLISHRNLGILFDSEQVLNSSVPFSKVLEMPIPDDEEGYVLDIVEDGHVTGHVKLKGERYKHLHAAIYGLSARKIWEYFSESEDAALEFIADLPDELQPWANSIFERLRLEYASLLTTVDVALIDVRAIASVSGARTNIRKELALTIKSKYPKLSGPIFAMHDGNMDRVREWILSEIKPGHELFRTIDEDAN